MTVKACYFNEADISVRLEGGIIMLRITDPEAHMAVLSKEDAKRLASALLQAAMPELEVVDG